MKDLLPPLVCISPAFANVSSNDLSLYERSMDRWGIALVSLVLLFLLAKWTAKREEKLEAARVAKDTQDHAERVKLAEANNELTAKLVLLTEKQIQVQQETIAELKLRRCHGVVTTHQAEG